MKMKKNVLDHGYHHLHDAGKALRGFFPGIMFLVPPGSQEDEQDQKGTVEHQPCHILGDGEIERPYLLTGGAAFDYLAAVFFTRRDIEALMDPLLEVP